MVKQRTCPSCQKIVMVPTQDGVALPDQRCSTCGFRLPNEAQGPRMRSSDYGD